jgi:hypothetical protein
MLIALCGAAGSGKNTVADRLVKEHGFYHIAFADPLYEMVSIVTGLPREDLEDREVKETVIDWLGKSPRELLQSLGTEWGRNAVNEQIWIMAAFRRVADLDAAGRDVVITDARFDNEAVAAKAAGGVVWRVVRRGGPRLAEGAAAHSSEAGVPDVLVDAEIANYGTVAELNARVDAAISMVLNATIHSSTL